MTRQNIINAAGHALFLALVITCLVTYAFTGILACYVALLLLYCLDTRMGKFATNRSVGRIVTVVIQMGLYASFAIPAFVIYTGWTDISIAFEILILGHIFFLSVLYDRIFLSTQMGSKYVNLTEIPFYSIWLITRIILIIKS